MTKHKRPTNKYERRLIAQKKRRVKPFQKTETEDASGREEYEDSDLSGIHRDVGGRGDREVRI